MPVHRRHWQVMHDTDLAARGIDASYELFELVEATVPAFVEGTRDLTDDNSGATAQVSLPVARETAHRAPV